jgi:hypothetical protein
MAAQGSEPRDAEFRGNVPTRLLKLIDAVAQADGMGRMEWAIPVLEREVERRLHSATVLCRMAGINPTGTDRGPE